MEKALGKLTPDTQASGSMLPALVGLNPYKTPNDCLESAFRAIDRSPNGSTKAPFEYIEAAEWGNVMENPILLETAKRLGCEINTNITEAVQHKTLPLAVSLDGILEGNGQVIKTDSSKGIFCVDCESITLTGKGVAEAKLTGAGPSSTPAPYRGPIQVQGSMMCTGYEWAAIGTLFKGTKLHIFLLKQDQIAFNKLAADIRDFQARLDAYKLRKEENWYPAMTPNDAQNIYSSSDEWQAPVELPNELSELALELADANRAEKAVKSLKSEINTRIMDFMKGSNVAKVMENGEEVGRITWPMRSERQEYYVPAKPAKRAASLSVKIYQDSQ